MGPGGVLYAGNTGGPEYAINPNGRRRWVFPTGNSVWSNAAIGRDGTVYFGSLDLNIYAVDTKRQAAMEAHHRGLQHLLSGHRSGGTVYVGSFDGALHALDPSTGGDRWTYATDDHVYSSPALGEGSVYIASADGSVYALDLRGNLRWRYDTGDTIRSSPVLGRAPRGGGAHPLRRLGQRRAVRPRQPHRPPALVLRHHPEGPGPARSQRPQLLARAGTARCLHRRRARPASCSFPTTGACAPAATRAATAGPVRPSAATSPGWPSSPRAGPRCIAGPPAPLPAATALTTRLLVRQVGETVDAGLDPAPRVTADPPFDFTAEPSGDGHFLHLTPDGFLRPGRRYEVRIEGRWTGDGRSGAVASTIRFRTDRVRRRGPPAQRRTQARVGLPAEPAGRAAAADPAQPQPDRLRLLRHGRGGARVCRRRERRGLCCSGRSAPNADRAARAGRPAGAFSFPLQGRYRHDALLLSQRGLSLTFSFGDVPLRRFDLRMQLGPDVRARGASLTPRCSAPRYRCTARR